MNSQGDLRLDKRIIIYCFRERLEIPSLGYGTCLGEEESEKAKELLLVKHSCHVLWEKYVLNLRSKNRLFVLGRQELAVFLN